MIFAKLCRRTSGNVPVDSVSKFTEDFVAKIPNPKFVRAKVADVKSDRLLARTAKAEIEEALAGVYPKAEITVAELIEPLRGV